MLDTIVPPYLVRILQQVIILFVFKGDIMIKNISNKTAFIEINSGN